MNIIEKAIENDRERIGGICINKSLKYKLAEFIIKIKYKDIRKKYPYLNLGCGNNFYNNFINVDILVNKKLLFSNIKNYLYMDVSKKWIFPKNYFEGIYTEHLLEHLTYKVAIDVLQKCYNSLKDGGVIRIIVPSLDKYLQNQEIINEYNGYKALAISNLTQNTGHISTWDFKLMKDILHEIGFSEVVKLDFKKGKNFALLKDTEVRKKYSMYIEAYK